jgi:DNA (cytosine-5)-methyltransferase 1
MTKFKEWNLDGTIDLLVGGTPCQSFSIAGLRKGLDDPRGNLMLTFGAIADHFRPSWLVWENVPGVLSSNKGRDFGAFLGMLGLLGYGYAFRILDAQFFGVAQRRRRVFVVGHLGDWRRSALVLFESQSLCRNTPPSRKAGEGTPAVAGMLAANGGGTNRPAGNCNELDFCVPVMAIRTANTGANGHGIAENVAHTLDRSNGQSVAIMAHGQANAETREDGIAHTLRGSGFDASEDGTGRGTPIVPVNGFHWQNGFGADLNGDLSGTLIKNQTPTAMVGTAVRRLTPRECERLQGFPDDWTLIPWKNRPAEQCPDGPRYKACGNSMAVPVMRWIGERIAVVNGMEFK